jgi:transcriptional regulator with XRE-family HTH domain
MKIKTTSDRLKEIMRERSIHQVDILRAAQPFCKKYGIKVGKNDLSQYVNGKVTPGQEKLTVLGLALNVSEAWLMGYDVPKDREQKTEKPLISEGLSLEGITETQRLIIEAILKMPVDRQRALAEILGLSE